MNVNICFKKVPSIYKCFKILDIFVNSKKALGISDVANSLGYHKGTVFNIIYSLADIGVLENGEGNKFHLGTHLYKLGKAAARGSELISTVHPYLEEINQKTRVSVFLGTRSGMRAVILDKVDSFAEIKVSTEVGMSLPLFAGAIGKALLSLMHDDEIDKVLSQNQLRKFTRFSCVDKEKYKAMIKKSRQDGLAFDKEEYREGIWAMAVPLKYEKGDSQMAICAVGLKDQLRKTDIPVYSRMLIETAKAIEMYLVLK